MVILVFLNAQNKSTNIIVVKPALNQNKISYPSKWSIDQLRTQLTNYLLFNAIKKLQFVLADEKAYRTCNYIYSTELRSAAFKFVRFLKLIDLYLRTNFSSITKNLIIINNFLPHGIDKTDLFNFSMIDITTNLITFTAQFFMFIKIFLFYY